MQDRVMAKRLGDTLILLSLFGLIYSYLFVGDNGESLIDRVALATAILSMAFLFFWMFYELIKLKGIKNKVLWVVCFILLYIAASIVFYLKIYRPLLNS